MPKPYTKFTFPSPFKKDDKPTEIVLWERDEEGKSKCIYSCFLEEIIEFVSEAQQDRSVIHVHVGIQK